MKRLSPKSFTGPRAYFTDFDPRIVMRTDPEKLRVKVERKLKALLLVKGKIVCAASHLTSQFAYNFFYENPILLTERAIVPALRADKSCFAELFEKKRFKEKRSAITFFEEHIQEAVDWDLTDNSSWFRNRFLADLEDENSLINRHIGQEHKNTLIKLADEISKEPLLSRDLIDRVVKGLPRRERLILINYRELLYHISGARAVNCESALPQENYIDYDLADLTQKRTRLSEDQILTKIFLELVFDSLQKYLLPDNLLDLLTFRDIIEIRKPLLNTEFQNNYDKLVQMAVCSYSDSPDEILDIDTLEQIRQKLIETFKEVLNQQLPKFLKKRAFEQAKQLLSNSTSLALGIAGFVPVYGMIASAINAMKDTPALLVNVGETYSSMKALRNIQKYQAVKDKIIKKKIEHSRISDKSAFYDMVDVLLSVMAMRLEI